MSKKMVLAYLIIAAMALLFSTGVVAEEVPDKSGKWEYVLKDGGAIITGYADQEPTGGLLIPDALDGYPVTSIGDHSFQTCNRLTSVIIKNGLTSIGKHAFSGCGSLTSVLIPDSVTSIGDGAFYDCVALSNITLPSGVTNIGSETFYRCLALSGITIPETVTSIGDRAFSGCIGFDRIAIPKAVTSIGNGAFSKCMRLTSVTIPETVTRIGTDAFLESNNVTLYVAKGSYGEEYAKEWNVAYASTDATYSDPELARAVSLGFGEVWPYNPQVTAAEFSQMLEHLIDLVDASKAQVFQNDLGQVRKSNQRMKRSDGFIMFYYAARALGGRFSELGGTQKLFDTIDDQWRVEQPSQEIFGFTNETQIYVDACSIALTKESLFSGKNAFEYDTISNSMRIQDPFTYQEALLATVRLYDSVPPPPVERVPSEVDRLILEAAQARIQTIRHSPTVITVTGRSYYVSNNGNDKNNGRSPEKAWATIDRVNRAKLKSGDGVFFERGGFFRGWLNCAENVTYSAYGIGDKPRLVGSPYSGVGADKWELWYDEDGIKIWKFYKEIVDCGGIVFDEGGSYANRVFSIWDGNEHVFVNDHKKPFDIVEGLQYDLQFYSAFDYGKYRVPYVTLSVDSRGPIYLRCDSGNPGEQYWSIEFQSMPDKYKDGYGGVITMANGSTADNLCVMYGPANGIHAGNKHNQTIQNCEIAWIGGGSHEIIINPWQVPCSGEGISMQGNNNIARNNYVHDCLDGGIIVEVPDEDMGPLPNFHNILIENNVIERCLSGTMVYTGWNTPGDFPYGEVTIRGNFILYSGYGWSSDPHFTAWTAGDYMGTSFNGSRTANPNSGTNVYENVLYLARYSLVQSAAKGANRPTFNHNVYVQNQNGYMISHWPLIENEASYFLLNVVMESLNVAEEMKDFLGDATGIVVSTDMNQPGFQIQDLLNALERIKSL